MTDQLVLTVGYDIENITNPALYADYRGEIVADRYGRKIPKHAHGTVNLKTRTSSSRKIMEAVMGLYDDIVNPKLLVRRITLVGNRLVEEARAEAGGSRRTGRREKTGRTAAEKGAQPAGGNAFREEKVREKRDA